MPLSLPGMGIRTGSPRITPWKTPRRLLVGGGDREKGGGGMSAAQKRTFDAERGMASDYRGAVQAQQKEQAEQFKYTFNKLIDSYDNSKSQTARESVVSTMKRMYNSAPPILRESVTPYLTRSPISPQAEKGREYDRLYPQPEIRGYTTTENQYKATGVQREMKSGEGEVTSGGQTYSVSESITDPQAYAESLFAQLDWAEKKNVFMMGESVGKIGHKDFIHLGPGLGASRLKSGQVVLQDQSQIDIKALDLSPSDELGLWARGGWTKPESTGVFIDSGRKITMSSSRNIFSGESTTTPSNIEAAPASPSTIQLPDDLRNLMAGVLSEDKDNEEATAIRELINNKPDKASSYLSTKYPGYHFSFEAIDPSGRFARALDYIPILGWLVSPKDNIAIYATKGTRTNLLGKIVYIEASGLVRNKKGAILAQSAQEAYNNIEAQLATKVGK